MRDVDAFIDPVCPWCWVTSRWLRVVSRETGMHVTWRFLSLRLLDEKAEQPQDPHIAAIHARGLDHLQLLACVRRIVDDEAVGRVLEALGAAIWEQGPAAEVTRRRDQVLRPVDRRGVLVAAGLDPDLADEVSARDLAVVGHETELAIDRVGPGLGTPVITFGEGGPSFFGPVVSRFPAEAAEAVAVWQALETLATSDGFAELRTQKRGAPELPLFRSLVADLPEPTVPRGPLTLTEPPVVDACGL